MHLTEAETGNYRLRHLHTADSAWLYWNANTFTDDQFVEAQVYPSQFGGSVLLWARTDGTLSNGYLMGISSAASLITFYYASSAFYFSLHASYSATIIGGDYARFEVSGQTPNIQLRGYINDVLVATLDEVDFTSSQIFGSGTVGLVIPYTDFVEQAVDNFRAGITTSGVSPSISPSESTSRSVSPSISRSVSPSVSPSLSPSSSVSPSISQSLSVSQSSSISRSESPSISASHSVSASTSRSKSPSSSPSASPSPSAAVTIHYGPRVQFT